jgi:hypothetical protein
VTTPLGDFGAPPDAVSWTALALGIVLAAGILARNAGPCPAMERAARGSFFVPVIVGLAALALALSAGYVQYYLHGGPRIVDATSYFLQARALSHGHVAFPIPSPSGNFRGRFLLASGDARSLSVIFPPGYPAVLAIGFLVHAPMLVGPAIGAGLVVVTAALALRLFSDRNVALLAAALSAVCAVLRYHTADTMSHGWSALLLALTLLLSQGRGSWSASLAGASAGLLVATRPVTGVVALLLVVLASRKSPRRLVCAALASVPPIVFLVVEQRIATGTWLGSTQLAYYALADSPPDCFRYGFGAGIGCRFEHGDFVLAHLAHGYGALAAFGTTLRRLKMHLADAGNAELFSPVLVFALARALGTGKGRLAAVGVLGIVLAYAPFYFDGNYPGGGARLFSDVLPLEHALLAWGLVRLGIARVALPLAFAGFALHTSYDHLKLARREGGRPMFEARVLADAGVRRGLVFVDTDHGFSLGHDPGKDDPESGVVVARRRNDAHDTILWERLGRPSAFSYAFAPDGAESTPHVERLALTATGPLRFEAEGEWPPLAVSGGSVVPVFPPCASGRRALSIEPSLAAPATMRIEIVAPTPGRYRLVTGWIGSSRQIDATLAVGPVTGRLAAAVLPGACVSLAGPVVDILKQPEFMDVSVESPQTFDYFELAPDR